MGIHVEIVSSCSYPYLTSTWVWANFCNTQSVHHPAMRTPPTERSNRHYWIVAAGKNRQIHQVRMFSEVNNPIASY